MSKLAKRLKELGKSQLWLDRETGAPAGSTSRWCRGIEHNWPQPRVLTKMVRVLKVKHPRDLGFDADRLWVCNGYANSARECGESSRPSKSA
jgi:hypothetical protein